MTRDTVLEILNEHQQQLREQYGVKSLAIFGSVARNEAETASDVDLLVEFDRPIGLLHLIGTQLHIQELLGIDRVDLVLRRAILPELKEEILTEAVDAF